MICKAFLHIDLLNKALWANRQNRSFQDLLPLHRNITLPLEPQGTVSEKDRRTGGAKIQTYLYGNEIKSMDTFPQDMNDTVQNFLTEMCFGDFYTRKGLDVKTRELLSLCVLATIGERNGWAMPLPASTLSVPNQALQMYCGTQHGPYTDYGT